MEPAWLDLEDAELMTAYARYWGEMQSAEAEHWSRVTRLQEILHSLHREMMHRGLWPFVDPNIDINRVGRQ